MAYFTFVEITILLTQIDVIVIAEGFPFFVSIFTAYDAVSFLILRGALHPPSYCIPRGIFSVLN